MLKIRASESSEASTLQLSAQLMNALGDQTGMLQFETNRAVYNISADAMDLEKWSAPFGENIALSDVTVHVKIANPAREVTRLFEQSAARDQLNLLAGPIEFTIDLEYKSQRTKIDGFNRYVERMIPLGNDTEYAGRVTAIRVHEDGSYHHVPTKVVYLEGQYYAVFYSYDQGMYAVVSHQAEFTDMESHWAASIVEQLGSRMIVNGIGDGRFEPNRDVTRAEFAAIIVHALGLSSESSTANFNDISETDWYAEAIGIAHAYGIVSGFANNEFRPNETLTREQAMVMLVQAMKVTQMDLPEIAESESLAELLEQFSDATELSEWARQSAEISVTTGLITGRNDSMLAPKESITRAEVAVIVYRLLEKSGLIG